MPQLPELPEDQDKLIKELNEIEQKLKSGSFKEKNFLNFVLLWFSVTIGVILTIIPLIRPSAVWSPLTGIGFMTITVFSFYSASGSVVKSVILNPV